MKKIFISTSIILLMLIACKKDETVTALTAMQKIQGKWTLETMATNDHYAGADHQYIDHGTAADIFDFRNDGKIYFHMMGSHDTIPYSLQGETKITINNTETYDIKTLSTTSLVIYKRDPFNSTDYYEETITWKR
jgi:hypothetical protein